MPQRLRRVLVAVTEVDGPETLLSLAAEFAQANGAELSVLLVSEPLTDVARIAKAAGITETALRNNLLADWTARYAELLDKMPGVVRPRLELRVGIPFVEIIQYVVEQGIDMVLKAPDSRGALLGHVLTSTDQHLLRKCPGAVWLSDAAPRGLPRSVVAAVDVDGGTASEPETVAALNQRILHHAMAIASRSQAELHLLHAWDAPGMHIVQAMAEGRDPVEAAKKYESRIRVLHEKAFAELEQDLRRLNGADGRPQVAIHAHLDRGAPRQVIPDRVRSLGAEVLVMGTTARTGVPGLVIGNTAEDVLNSVECGLLSVKPPNFESPIRAS